MNERRSVFLRIIREVCADLGIECDVLSEGWIVLLQAYGRKGFIYSYSFGINEDSAAKICTDKYATFLILSQEGIPVVQYELIYTQIYRYRGNTSGNWKKILEFFYKHGRKIVVKPNKGASGKKVYFVENEVQLEKAVSDLLSDFSQIVLSPFYEVNCEYRVVVLDEKVELIVRKDIPYIEGDGKSTIYELLFTHDINNPEVYENLSRKNKLLSHILEKGKRIYLLQHHNLTKGAKVKIIERKPQIEGIALRAMKALNLRFGSVDIIETRSNKYLILEVNPGVTLVSVAIQGNYCKVKNIYKRAIKRWLQL